MFLAKQVQYDRNQVMRPADLIVGDQYQICKRFQGEHEILFIGQLRLVYTSDQKIVISTNDGMGDLHLDMHSLHLIPDKNGQWDASTTHLVRVPLLKSSD